MTHLEDLPIEERARLYREHASRMMRLANSCSSDSMRMAYLRLAAQWQSLALELEREPSRAIQLVASQTSKQNEERR